MKATTIFLFLLFFAVACEEKEDNVKISLEKTDLQQEALLEIPKKNIEVIETVLQYGAEISPTYEKAVCTELVIQVLEKVEHLNDTDKSRIRIITNENIQELLNKNSEIPKGVYFSLIEKGVGIPINNKKEVLEGDFVQFWTETWGHCGIVRSINTKENTMELYSSFPSTNGYGIQKFDIPKNSFFVRLK